MRLLVDMNLSPDWVPTLIAKGWPTLHWSRVGAADAADTELMRWARENAHVIITQDLDFSQLLFAMREGGPSVVLLPMDNEFDAAARAHVCAALAQAELFLLQGALLTVSSHRIRMRLLLFAAEE